MKKHLLCLLAIFSALVSQAQSNPAGTVIYSLPQTVLSITVQSEREAFTAGPYASYAQKYLGVAARQKSETTYTVKAVTVTPLIEADQSARYTVNIPDKASTTFLSFCSQGLIAMSDNYTGVAASWHFAPQTGVSFEGLDATASLGKVTTTLYKPVQTDDGLEEIAVPQSQIVEKSIDKKAGDCAAAIFDLREKRQQIATGDTDATFSGEAMQSALNEIERLEKQYLSLFYGIKQVSSDEKTFDIVPGTSKSQTVSFPCNGRTFTLEMDAETVANPENSEKGRDASVIYYRVPATVRCVLKDGGLTLIENRIPVYQMGQKQSFPVNVIINK